MKFPNNLYVIAEDDSEDDPSLLCFADKEFATSGEEDGKEVAVYQLVKRGVVKNTTRIVFE